MPKAYDSGQEGSMSAKLLCVVPDLECSSVHARLIEGLAGRLRASFADTRLFSYTPTDDWTACVYGSGDLSDLKHVLGAYDPTHVLVVGGHSFLSQQVRDGVCSQHQPHRQVVCVLLVDTPLPIPEIASVPPQFDACVTLGSMAKASVRNAAAAIGALHKSVYQAARAITPIVPGINTDIFKPIDRTSESFGREDVRHALFSGQLDDSHTLVVFPPDQQPELALGVLSQLTQRLEKPLVGLYMGVSPDWQALVDGYDLNDLPLKQLDWPADAAQRRLVWCAADLVITTCSQASWPFDAQEAMACGAVVCAPDQHCWSEALHERAIEAPTPRLTAVGGGYSYTIEIGSTVDTIVRSDWPALTEMARLWCEDTRSSWSYTAEQLLEVLGVA